MIQWRAFCHRENVPISFKDEPKNKISEDQVRTSNIRVKIIRLLPLVLSKLPLTLVRKRIGAQSTAAEGQIRHVLRRTATE